MHVVKPTAENHLLLSAQKITNNIMLNEGWAQFVSHTDALQMG